MRAADRGVGHRRLVDVEDQLLTDLVMELEWKGV